MFFVIYHLPCVGGWQGGRGKEGREGGRGQEGGRERCAEVLNLSEEGMWGWGGGGSSRVSATSGE